MRNKNKHSVSALLLALLMLLAGCSGNRLSSDSSSSLVSSSGEMSVVSSLTEPAVSSDAADVTEGGNSDGVVDFGSSEVVEIFSETEEGSAAEEAAAGDEASAVVEEEAAEAADEAPAISEDGTYTSKDEVALYIHTYGRLPSNYITKNEAQKKGWDSSKGNLAKACPGMSIGGDKFGNREKLLPTKKGRQYYECDIDYVSGSRNAKRIVFSNDGLVYYTQDHYSSFELLYE